MAKKAQSTYDEYVNSLSKERKKEFDSGYQELILSELLQAIMKNDDISVRELAAAAGVSPTIVQGLRSGKRNVTMDSVSKVFDVVGYELTIQPKESKR